jgi:hypothetical protein
MTAMLLAWFDANTRMATLLASINCCRHTPGSTVASACIAAIIHKEVL